MRLSIFVKYIIWLCITVPLFVISLNHIGFEYGPVYMFTMALSIILILFGVMSLQFSIVDILSLKFRVYQDTKHPNIYEAQRLVFNAMFFGCHWEAVSRKFNSYDYENIFGGTMTSHYYTDNYFINKEYAIKAINGYKEKEKLERLKFFKRPEKIIKKIDYIK